MHQTIYCSVEPWDSILGYNRPNGTSKTWNFKEDKKPSILNTVTDDIFDCSEEEYKISMWVNNLGGPITRLEIHEIEDKKHLYIIRVLNAGYFFDNLNQGFSCISPKVLSDVKEGKAKIVLEITSEPKYMKLYGTEYDVIERWRIKESLPEFSVAVISGNLKVKELVKDKNLKLKLYSSSTFLNFFGLPGDEWYSMPDRIVHFNPEMRKGKNLFLSYNRNPRYHRVELGYRLFERKLLDLGQVSLQFEKKYFVEDARKKGWVKSGRYFVQGPRLIDRPLDSNFASDITLPDYEATFCSLVTETSTDNGCLFFSEKTWKPIAIGHPFILLSSPGSLKWLKDNGYKTFDRWWDESYDNETNVSKRTNMIVDIISQLSRKTSGDLEGMRAEMKEVLVHNRKRYLEQYYESTVDTGDNSYMNQLNIYEHLKDIYSSIE